VFEWSRFSAGTRSLARAIGRKDPNESITLIGGGDTASAAEAFGIVDEVTHCSTGGGAGLELLEGKTLPGVAFLES